MEEERKDVGEPEIFNFVTNFRRQTNKDKAPTLTLRLKDCNNFLTTDQKEKFADYEIDTDSEIAFHGTATDIFDFTSKCYINVTTLKVLEQTISGLIKASGKQGAEDEVQGLAKKYTNH